VVGEAEPRLTSGGEAGPKRSQTLRITAARGMDFSRAFPSQPRDTVTNHCTKRRFRPRTCFLRSRGRVSCAAAHVFPAQPPPGFLRSRGRVSGAAAAVFPAQPRTCFLRSRGRVSCAAAAVFPAQPRTCFLRSRARVSLRSRARVSCAAARHSCQSLHET